MPTGAVYHPWRLFEWWYFFDAYAPAIFLRGGAIAASSSFAAAGAAVAMAVWRSPQTRRVTTYGSARWAEPNEIEKAGLTRPAGVFLGNPSTHVAGRMSVRRWAVPPSPRSSLASPAPNCRAH